MVLSYFGKEPVEYCRGKKKPCSTREACEKVGKARKNPWTGRNLRGKIRAELVANCAKKKAVTVKKVRGDRKITIPYTDRYNDAYEVRVPADRFGAYVINPREMLGNPGTYWNTYASADGKYAVKVWLLKTEKERKTLKSREEKIYKMASNHDIGPEVFSWFYIPKDELTVIDMLNNKQVRRFDSLAVAVVTRYDSIVTKRIEKMPSYSRLYRSLDISIDIFEDLHGIINVEWTKKANLLVKLNAEGDDITKLVVGDWGKTEGGDHLKCDPSEK